MSKSTDEVAYHLASRQAAADALRDRPRPSLLDRVALAQLSEPELPITPPRPADYEPPAAFAKIFEPEARVELRALLGELAAFRAQVVGLTETEVEVLYNGDDRVVFLGEAFSDWTLRQLHHRLFRPSPRDGTDKAKTYVRLLAELPHWVEALAAAPRSGHRAVLPTAAVRAVWELRQATGGTPELCASGSPEALRQELARMAADLLEAKPLLIRSYRPEANVVPAGRFAATWGWYHGHCAGILFLGADAEDLHRGTLAKLGGLIVQIGIDGMPSDLRLPWIARPDVVPWVVGVLRPLHERIVALWDAAPRPAVVAEDAVRRTQLLSVLERYFGVEVRPGKGSEATVWRPGGRKYVLGGHRRNTHFHSHIVGAMLKALGIAPGEFAAVVGRA